MKEELKKETANSDLGAVMRSIYFWLYAVSKLGMFYTIFQENWTGLIGFGLATGVCYVEMMKRS